MSLNSVSVEMYHAHGILVKAKGQSESEYIGLALCEGNDDCFLRVLQPLHAPETDSGQA